MDKIFLHDVLAGLHASPKTLPCKYFYDRRGSELFEKICACDDYYVTRTEMALLQEIAPQLGALLDANTALIEPGAGGLKKVSILLQAAKQLPLYAPLDISGDFLHEAAANIARHFPNLQTQAIVGDFTKQIDIDALLLAYPHITHRLIFFPGSTFGNFDPIQGQEFLQNMRHLIGNKGGMIIGVDAVKPVHILERAYDDSEGVTAAFNKNLLKRINDELGGDFNLSNFKHRAVFNQQHSRIEMHLDSMQAQNVPIGEQTIAFDAGESIHTENSYKYDVPHFTNIAGQAGFTIKQYWQDSKQYFTIFHLMV